MQYTAFFLGVVGLLQFYFLPGALILRGIRYRANPMQFIIFSAGLSLVFNYVLVYLLVVLGVFSSHVVRSVLCLEILSLLVLSYSWLCLPWGQELSGRWSIWLASLVSSKQARLNIVLFVLLLGIIVFLVCNIYFHLGDVFSVNDEKDSWNLWALVWSGGHIPGPNSLNSPGIYPQLIPTNYALLYKIIGRESGQPYIVYLARNFMPVFLIIQLLMTLDLAIKTKDRMFLMGGVLIAALTFILVGKYIPRGYVDIPLAMMTCIAGFSLLESWFCRAKFTWREVIILAVVCAGCGVTKQGGLFISIFFPLFVYMQLKDDFLDMSAYLYFLISYLIILAIVVPWYVHTLLVHHGIYTGNTAMLIESSRLYGGHGGVSRYLWELKKNVGCFVIFLGFAVVAMCRDQRWRSLMCFTLVYILLWFVFMGYDVRNLSLSFPFVGLSASAGIAYCIQQERGRVTRYFMSLRYGFFVFLITLTVAVASASKHLRYDALLKIQQASVKLLTGKPNPKMGKYAYYPYGS